MLNAPLSLKLVQGIVELPYLIAQASAYSLLTYFMIGFEMSARESDAWVPLRHLFRNFFYCLTAVPILPPSLQPSSSCSSCSSSST